jgi:hypothetical protein
MQRLAAGGAVGEVGQQAHEARHPELEVGERHPGLLDGGDFEDGDEEAVDGVLRVALGEDLIEQFGVEAEHCGADGVDGRSEGRADDLELIEADEFLAGALGEEGASQGHGLKRAAEAFAAFEGGFGRAFKAAVVAGEEADDEVGLMHGPGAQNHGFR